MGKLSNANILVIDKDVFARHSLADDLASYSATVRTAREIEDATELMRQSDFDAVIFDINLTPDKFRELFNTQNRHGDNKPVFIAYLALSNINRCALARPFGEKSNPVTCNPCCASHTPLRPSPSAMASAVMPGLRRCACEARKAFGAVPNT